MDSVPHGKSTKKDAACGVRVAADQVNFTLNFSKGASQIVAQYYQVGNPLPPTQGALHLCAACLNDRN